MTRDPAELTRIQPPFGHHVGCRITHAGEDRVEGELTVTPELTNRNGVLHGGVIMSLADNLGGMGSTLLLKEGEMTTTVESKTNFFRSVAPGEVLRAVSVPLHAGRTTQVWQTTLTREDGKIAAQVTQTQMTLRRR